MEVSESAAARPVMLITGGGRGIGAATAVMASARGFDVVINYVTDERAANVTSAACRTLGARTLVVQGDVADEADVIELFRLSVDQLGPLAVVVNNAGILHRASRLDEFDVDRLRSVVAVNVIGAILVAREAVRHMSTRHGGSGGTIVNVSSAASYLGSPNEYIDYAATKGAIDSMTIGLAKEVAMESIRVNAVRPGLIYTDIHESSGIEDRVDRRAPEVPMQRGGQPSEVAEAILWLASPASSFVTGTFVDVTGGR